MSLLSNFQDIITAVKMGLSKKVDEGDFNTALNLKADKTTVNALDARVTQVNQLVNNINSFTVSVVETLPTGDDIQENVIYFMPAEDEEDNNVYYEFMYIENDWELIGTTAVDLSNYPTTSDMESWVNGQGFAKSSNLAEVATTGAYASLSGAPSSSDVASNTSARHTHSNKTVIDKFSEVSGELKYDGSNVALEDALVATATFSGATQGSGYLGTLDKSNVEILDAFERGKNVWVEVSDGSGITTSVPISSVKDMGLGDTYQEITFSKVFVSSSSEMKEMILVVNSSSSEIYNFTYYETVPDYVSGSASSDITANTTARHTHSNKTVLDKFSESGGDVLYDGSEIGGGGFYVGDTAPQDTDVLWIDTSDNSLDVIYGGGASRLPYGYQEVEYIQSSGTQYIDTGLKINDCAQVTAVLSFDDLTINQNNGVDEGDSTNYSMINYRNDNKAQTVYYKSGVGSEFFKFGSITSTSQKYKIQVSQVLKYAFLDGAPYQLVSLIRATGNTYNFFIAAGNSQGTPLYFAHEKIYSFNFSDDLGEPTGKFVPCYRKSDNEIGMYDLVTNTFFTNAGTGEFTMGDPVSSLPTAIPDGTGGTY